MACSQTLAGIKNDCALSMGGIKRVWLADYKEEAATVDNEKVNAIALVSGTTWHPYYFRKNTGSMTSTLTVDQANGVNYVTTELSLVFTKMDTVKRIEMAVLATADVMAVVEDANGTKWFLGKDNPLSCTAGAGETGTAKGDGNKYTLTLTDESKSYPYEVTNDVELPEVEKVTE